MARTKLRPGVDNFVNDFDASQAGRGGRSFAGTLDLENLSASNLSKKARKKLGDQLPEVFSIDQARELGLELKDFSRQARKDLRNAGLSPKKVNTLVSQRQIEQFTGGVEGPERGQEIEQAFTDIQDKAIENLSAGIDLQSQGVNIARGDLSNPFVKDFLGQLGQQFNASRAASGFGGSGNAAFHEVVGGGAAALQLGQQIGGFGSQVAANAGATLGQTNPFLFPEFALQRNDLGFNRNLGFFMFDKQQESLHRANKQLSFENQFKSNLGASFGQAVGSGGGLFGGGGGGGGGLLGGLL